MQIGEKYVSSLDLDTSPVFVGQRNGDRDRQPETGSDRNTETGAGTERDSERELTGRYNLIHKIYLL